MLYYSSRLTRPKQFTNGIQISEYIHSLVPALQEKGFLAASIDSMAIKGPSMMRGYMWGVGTGGQILRLMPYPALITAAAIMPGQWVKPGAEPEAAIAGIGKPAGVV